MKAKKIILNCDPGMDDSMTIVVAVKMPQLDVKAITTVNGNYSVDVTAGNAPGTLELLGRADIPVVRGMAEPIFRESPKDLFTHGESGQTEDFLPEPMTPLYERHAVDLIIDLIKEYPNEIYILFIGPMSNLAMVMKKAPEVKGMIVGIYAISGMSGQNPYAFANVTGDAPRSEWNVYVDPEVASIVYHSDVQLVALGLDVATHSDVNLTEEDLERLRRSGRREARFLYRSARFMENRGFETYCAVIGCMAVGHAIGETLVETFQGHVGIETKDGLTLGNTVADYRHHHVWETLLMIRIGKRADYGASLKMLMELVLR